MTSPTSTATHAPGVSLPRAVRDAQIVRLREEGLTLEAIAAGFGLNRERVRQIVRTCGGPSAASVRRHQAVELEQARLGLKARIVEHLTLNPGLTRSQVAEALGCTTEEVSAALGADARRLLVQAKEHHRIGEHVLLGSLRLAAELVDGPLTVAKYERVRRTYGLPSAVLIVKRLGTWAAACRRAGVTPGDTPRRAYVRRWTPQQMVAWVARYLAEPGCPGSFAGYEGFARTLPGAPGGQTVRDHLGSWAQAKAAALTLVATKGRDGFGLVA